MVQNCILKLVLHIFKYIYAPRKSLIILSTLYTDHELNINSHGNNGKYLFN